MNQDQTTEYITAFVIGAAMGVAAALLLAPEPPTRREKIMKELKPYRKKIQKRTAKARKQMSKQVGKQASAAADFRDELLSTGRAVIKDLRSEVAELVAEARNEIAASVESQLESAQGALKKNAKRIRS